MDGQPVGKIGSAAIQEIVSRDHHFRVGRAGPVQQRIAAVHITAARQFAAGRIQESQSGVHLGIHPFGPAFDQDALAGVQLQLVVVHPVRVCSAVYGQPNAGLLGRLGRSVGAVLDGLIEPADDESSRVRSTEPAHNSDFVDPRSHVPGDGHLKRVGNRSRRLAELAGDRLRLARNAGMRKQQLAGFVLIGPGRGDLDRASLLAAGRKDRRELRGRHLSRQRGGQQGHEQGNGGQGDNADRKTKRVKRSRLE